MFFFLELCCRSQNEPIMTNSLQPLLDEIQARMETAQTAIAEAGMAGDWQQARAIVDSVKELEQVKQRLAEVRRDLRKAVSTFDELVKSGTKGPQTRLVIRVNWRADGYILPDTLVDEPTGAEALAKFLEALVSVRGTDVLSEIQRIQCGGRSLISKHPRQDFINPETGDEYGHRPIGNSGWHVKTHSSTKVKVEQIHQIKALLGFPRHMIEVDVLEK